MDGIEALQMMKKGYTVVMHRNKGTTSPTDAFYRFDFKYMYDKEETSKDIWTRFRCEKYWHKCENPARFWMVADNFEVVGDE